MQRCGGSGPRGVVVSSVLALVAGLGMAGASPAAAAEVTRVVGLGDSYASGEGAGDYDPPTDAPLNQCHRSPRSWQRIVDIPNATGEQYTHVACSGAKVVHVLNERLYNEAAQVTALQNITAGTVVLVSIGGNDVGFEGIIKDCLAYGCLETPAEVGAVETRIIAATREIRRALDAVVARAPAATVVLAGYPQLIQGVRCVGIILDEGRELDRLAILLRRLTVGQVMQMRMGGKKVRFADTIDPFKGHGACNGTDNQWINSLSTGGFSVESFHPNAAGYRAYATAVTTALRTDPIRCTSAGCRVRFADESVYYSSGGGTRAVTGRIRTGYEAAGEETSFLGYPLTDEYAEPGGRGQRFGGGDFFYRYGAETAFWSRGRILAKFKLTGDAGGPLGYPVTNEFTVGSGEGKRQNFQFGSVFYEHGTTEAFWSTGPILDKYRTERYDEGKLGWPVTDYACGLQPGNACRQHFDGSGGSVVYWTTSTGAHKVIGAIRDYYASTGWQNSHPDPASPVTAGYPTGDEYISPYSGHYEQNFERGRIEYYQGSACWWVLGSDACFR